jgi:hypothetical protein
MKPIIACAAISALSLIVSSGAIAAGQAGAAQQHPTATTGAAHTTQSTTTRSPAHVTGQPNQSCETTPNTPGNSVSAPGSAFNPDGTAGGVYAGEQTQNKRNTASVSQYDVACARPSR